MTTMPPEMSTAAANPSPSALTPAPVARDSLVSLQAQRSRFMINDILAAHQNGATNTTNLNIQQHQHTHQPYQQHMLQQQHQHQIALQHYIAQQQHLLQQRSQLNGSPTLPSSTSLLNQNPNTGTTTQQQQQATLTSACVATTTSQGQPAYTHAFGHLPNSTLMSFSGGPNGLHAAQAAVHYANLQYRERERSERSRLLENDERSRSPAPIQSTHSLSPAVAQRDLCNNTLHNTSGISAGGGGSSISGDQASTIDDSDSDCGAKDDDGHSVKSSDNLMGLTKKQRKARTAFTDHQLQTLEKSFERQKYLSVQDRMELANKLELSDCQVKTWYQNRRTKWKRQTAVGLELLAEAGNYAAFQRLYGGSPYLAPWPYAAAQAPPHLTGSTPIDLYYRQAAAAAVLQKPLTYRMYPSVPPLASAAALSSLPVHPPPPIPHLNASSSLTTLSNYYQTATQTLNSSNENNNFPSVSSNLRNASPNRSDDDEQRNSVEIVNRSPSPQLNPGSPPERNESPGSCPPTSSVSDNESDSENANIEV